MQQVHIRSWERTEGLKLYLLHSMESQGWKVPVVLKSYESIDYLHRFLANGRPNDQSSLRYMELLQSLAESVSELYPGWRLRVYHNVTESDSTVT